MPWNRVLRTGRYRSGLALALLAIALACCGSSHAQDKRIVIFSPMTAFTLPVAERDGHDYVGLVEALEPLGTVAATKDGSRWKLRFNLEEAEFTAGQAQVKLKGKTLTMTAPFRLESGRGLVPISGLRTLVEEVTTIKPVVFHEDARRLFVGKVAVRFTEELRKDSPPYLVLTFTSPVSPTIASEPGRVRLTFTREPIMPPPVTANKFDDPVISSAQYEENNGVAILTISTSAPLLASFINEGRTLTLRRAPPTQASQPPSPAPTPVASGTVEVPANANPAATPPAPTAAPLPEGLRRFFAVIDASHGGDERGAKLSDELQEKDVCLSFARHLLKEFQNRGLSALILRDTDTTLSVDQRASLANSAHPAVYISIHAASEGRGVRVYTALIPFSGNAVGPFQPWEAAQAPYVRTAVVAAASVATELRKHQIPAHVLSAPLRPLNNVVAAAFAIEVSSPDGDLQDLVAPNYQDSVASAVADGVANVRPQLEAAR